ncbi:hypothetical protein EGH22_19090 [Halomicroarcula sp. F28]|uniref:hypothetical protein n=1 Tax=Haloarcula salinisoli TaxID=2487746 RepID=UPI001C73547E|nr:hypothetical protein [Halomicroarcula salinisoli]MBX0288441.1 hypothetical protein [Halomicroarcula salinisoli]
MPEIQMHGSKEEVKISEILGEKDYNLGETIDVEEGFSIRYDGSPIQKDVSGIDFAVQFSINFNVELTDLVSEYLAYRIGKATIQIGDEEIENPTKEKIDEAFREAIEDE